MNDLAALLERAAAGHDHLCPRQVLGVRIGMHAAQLLDLDLPQNDKRVLTFVETDGCFADGVAVATGCWLGRRTLRLVDVGKVAATVVDTHTARAIRIRPHGRAREHAMRYAPSAPSRWHAYLAAYQSMPVADLLEAQPVVLTVSIAALISRPGARVVCHGCGEEIVNEREVWRDEEPWCRACVGDGYYQWYDRSL